MRMAVRWPTGPSRGQRGFTLVEMLVVIAIVGIMLAFLLPAVQAAREAARRTQCSANLGRIAMALQGYEMSFRMLPAGTRNPSGPIESRPVGMHHSWIVQLLPYLDEANAYRAVDQSVSVYDEANAAARRHPINLLRCPTMRSVTGGYSHYAGVHHDVEAPIDESNHGVFVLNRHIRLDDVTDGVSYTIFVGEKWLEPGDLGWISGTRATLRNFGSPLQGRGPSEVTNLSFAPDPLHNTGASVPEEETDSIAAPSDSADPSEASGQQLAPKPPLVVGGFGSFHGSVVQFAFGDGSVRSLHDGIPLDVLQKLGHREDGALIDMAQF